MTYATTNPPVLMVPAIGARPQIWFYQSADDDATVNGASYFSNGDALGMNKGDIVFVYDTTTPKTSVCYVSAVTAGGAATTAFAAIA